MYATPPGHEKYFDELRDPDRQALDLQGSLPTETDSVAGLRGFELPNDDLPDPHSKGRRKEPRITTTDRQIELDRYPREI